MKDVEDDIEDAGARIIWVLTEDSGFAAADSTGAHNYFRDTIDTVRGFTVGDGETEPDARAFDASPVITTGRGFAMVVRRSDMQVVYSVNYASSSPSALLSEVEAIAAGD